MKAKIKRITCGSKQYNFEYDPGEEALATAWYDELVDKTRPCGSAYLSEDHTVADIDNPCVAMQASLQAALAAVTDENAKTVLTHLMNAICGDE